MAQRSQVVEVVVQVAQLTSQGWQLLLLMLEKKPLGQVFRQVLRWNRKVGRQVVQLLEEVHVEQLFVQAEHT